jgi:hypothetical protein
VPALAKALDTKGWCLPPWTTPWTSRVESLHLIAEAAWGTQNCVCQNCVCQISLVDYSLEYLATLPTSRALAPPCRDEAVPSRCLPCLCALTQATQPLFQANNIDPSTLSRQQATDLITSCITIMYQPMQAAG